MRPSIGFISPRIVRSSVVLPQPLGPTMPRISLERISNQSPNERAVGIAESQAFRSHYRWRRAHGLSDRHTHVESTRLREPGQASAG